MELNTELKMLNAKSGQFKITSLHCLKWGFLEVKATYQALAELKLVIHWAERQRKASIRH